MAATRKHPPRPNRARLLGIAALVLLVGGSAALIYADQVVTELRLTLPPTPDVATVPVSTLVVDHEGVLLRPFTTAGGRWRLPVTIPEVDPRFLKMLVAYEDRTFREHRGIDWSSMARAALQFVGAGGHIVSGGSTLTMQVARLIESGSTRSAWGKLRQMVHADSLEYQLSKDEILTLYLTLAPYGGNIEGVRAASLAYFGKEPKRLSIAESALLVALPQSPEARRPDRDPAAARASRNNVIDRMLLAGVISAEEAEVAKGEPVPRARQEFPMLAAHLAQAALAAHPNERVIELPIDARLQAALEHLASTRATKLGPNVSVAVLVADQQTGDILASVGSAGFLKNEAAGFIDMTAAVRSPGSTLKPLIYGLAFELGLAHPESLIEDRPTGFGNWVPVNFDGFTRGTVTVKQALMQSLNIPAVITLDAVGTPRLVQRMKRAHAIPELPANTSAGLAIGLGGVGLTLRDLVSIYASIARGGTPVHLEDGVTPPQPDPASAAPVLDPVAAWYVTSILADVPPPVNGTAGRIAFKTGTSYGYRDAWAIGYDGRTVIGVWVGRPDGAPVPGIAGITAAAPILFESFDRLGKQVAQLPGPPPGVIFGSNADLPEPLKRFRHPDQQMVARDAAPIIAFPADGVDVDLGLAAGATLPLNIKIRNGVPPFTFFANGAPFGRSAFARQTSWTPDGPGYVTLSVVDAEGRSDLVKVFVE
jgi:penicillin-binding protein 1C